MTVKEMRLMHRRWDKFAAAKHVVGHHRAGRDAKAMAESWRQTAEICQRLDRIAELFEKRVVAEVSGSRVGKPLADFVAFDGPSDLQTKITCPEPEP